MNNHHTLNPFVSVRNGNDLIKSYVAVLGGKLISTDVSADCQIRHAEVQIGDATIGITEVLPQANYAWLITDDVKALKARIEEAAPGWQILPTDPQSPVIHAMDPAGITWIIQPAPPVA